MLRLHYYPSNASMAPHIVLRELGVPFELVLVDRTQDAHKSADYLRLNPNGLIPVLTDGDLVLFEAAAICLHLADTHPQAALAPPLGTAERAHYYKWMAWLTNTLQATLILYFYPERWALPDQPLAITTVKARAEAQVGRLLEMVEAEFARHGGPWLLGPQYSVADPYLLMLCRWTRGFGRPARDLPQLGRYLQSMLARPAVRRTFEAEGISAPLV